MADNPLSGYFRQPAVYISLPSGGKFWPQDALEIPESGELPVYPMTAVDEITYRTPDALFNGDAVARVIQSCIPAIKNAWGMPSIDVAAILSGIRIASYGHAMDIDTTCPKCSANSTFTFDLRNVTDNIQTADYTKPLVAGDLEIYFKPLNYKQITKSSLDQFQSQQLANSANNENIDEGEKLRILAESYKQISAMNINAVAHGIYYIKTPSDRVADPRLIHEFLTNCDKSLFESIRTHIINNNNQMQLKPLHIKCDECSHEWEQPFTMDMSDFFGQGS